MVFFSYAPQLGDSIQRIVARDQNIVNRSQLIKALDVPCHPASGLDNAVCEQPKDNYHCQHFTREAFQMCGSFISEPVAKEVLPKLGMTARKLYG